MKDDWLESLAHAFLVVMAFALVLAGLVVLVAAPVVNKMADEIGRDVVGGIGLVLALVPQFLLAFFPGSWWHPELRIGGLLLFGGAVLRVLGL